MNWHRQALNRNGHYNKHLQNAWNKYGKDAFEFGIVCECAIEDLDNLEREYIADYKSDNVLYGYNEESGGCKMKHHSQRTKQKLSERFMGTNNPMYGIRLEFSEETRKKLSIAHTGKKNGFYGKRHTEDTKRRMSEKKKGIKWPIEAILGRGQNKPVRCLNNGIEFETLSLAAKWAKATAPESISRVCKHKQKTAGIDPETGERLKWEFVELSHTAQ